jgi:hypothetical protein
MIFFQPTFAGHATTTSVSLAQHIPRKSRFKDGQDASRCTGMRHHRTIIDDHKASRRAVQGLSHMRSSSCDVRFSAQPKQWGPMHGARNTLTTISKKVVQRKSRCRRDNGVHGQAKGSSRHGEQIKQARTILNAFRHLLRIH